jgi:hypothetical protein
VLAKYDIRLPDIRMNPETGETDFDGCLDLPIDKYTDFKKLTLEQAGKIVTNNEQSCLKLQIKDITSVKNMLV